MTTTRDEVVQGGAQLDALLRTLPDKMQKNVNRSGLRAGAAVFLKGIRQRAPVRSGDLVKTARISSRNTPEGPVVSVKVGGKHKGVDAWYAHLVEFGTRPHVIRATEKDGALKFGGTLTRSVEHPGTRARPFVRPTVDAEFPEAVRAITDKIRDRLKKQGLNVPDAAPEGDE